MEGVEGLVHISELAQHHVENPREVVDPGDEVKVKILEIDDERRRLSLSLKRVEGQVLPLPRARRPRRTTTRQTGERRGAGPRPLRGGLRRRRPAEAAAEAPPRPPRPTPRSPWPRSRAAPRARAPRRQPSRRARGAASRGSAEAEAEPAAEPTSSQPRPSRRRRAERTDLGLAVRRLDRRPRLRQVGGAGRVPSGWARPTLSSDAVVHELLGTDEVRDLLRERWGDGVRRGRRGRPRGGRARSCSSDPEELALARGRAVPARRRCGSPPGARSWKRRDPPPRSAVVEVPLLFEAGIEGFFDATIAVVADEALRARARRRARPRGRGGPRGRASSHRRKRPRVPTTSSATTAPWRSSRGTVGEVLDQLRARVSRMSGQARWPPASSRVPERVPRTRRPATARRTAGDRCSASLGLRRGRRAIVLAPDGRRRDQGDHAAAAPRGHDPPAGARQEPRPGADRGRHLPRVEVPRP